MSEQNPKWVDDLRKVHERLKVDETFKAELRSTLFEEGQKYPKPRRSQDKRKRKYLAWGAAAAVVAVVVLLWNLLPGQNMPRVNAADLKLKLQFNTVQQLGQETSVAVAMGQDTAYYAVPKQGVYRQQGLTYEQIVTGDVSAIALSPDGKQLAYVEDRKLHIWDADTRQTKLAVEAPVPLSEPAWSHDGKQLAYVRHDPATDTVWETQLASGEQRYLAKGSSPSYYPNGEQILYAKQERIYTLDLKSGTEKLWGDGYSPKISPDGKYVLYVRKDGDDLKLEDAWIADLDRQTEQKITRNHPMDAWENGQPKEGELQPSYSLEGLAWSTDVQSVAMYQVTQTNALWRQLVRYTLAEQEAKPEEVVGQAIEALIYRDERHAHEYFSYDPGYLKGTSPRQVGYTIVNTKAEADGKTTVTAKINYSHYDPYYKVETYQFTLSRGSDGYLIDNMEEIDSISITDWDDEFVTTTEDDQRDQLIFRPDQVPVDNGWTNVGYGNIVYRESDSGRQIWFLVKQQQGDLHRMHLMRYDWDKGAFHSLGILDGVAESSMMIIDEAKQWAAIDCTLGEEKYDIAVLPLTATDASPVYLSAKLQGLENYQTINTRLWKGSNLSFYVEWNGRDVFFDYKE
jgi:Tol biopolymer transport system component